MGYIFHLCDNNAGRRCLFHVLADKKGIFDMRFYPPLPAHEQIRKPFQWPRNHLDSISFNSDKKRCGGMPKKGIPTVQVKIIEMLKKVEWATCCEIAVETAVGKKTVQETVRILYGKGILKRRRNLPHKYEYCLSELPKLELDSDKQKCRGRPKKGAPTVQIKIIALLEKVEWATCCEMAVEADVNRKTVQEIVSILYSKDILKRRRKTPHEYEYSLSELPKQPR